MPDYLPIMLDVRGRKAVVIGGDAMAVGRARALAECGASVHVIADDGGEALQELAAGGAVQWLRRAYSPGDLRDAFVVFAVERDEPQLSIVEAESRYVGALLHVTDVPDRCAFIMPSILRRGDLAVAVSTAGASPTLARWVRQGLEQQFPAAYGDYLRLARVARQRLLEHGVTAERRDRFFEGFAASDILTSLETGSEAAAQARLSALFEQEGVPYDMDATR
jgi:precorrin-2 dehydrogenase/sirohydrochlorin ferrochelatase